MKRLLHTADVHLGEGHPERWDALEAVLETAAAEEADAVLVAGDLLDRGEDHASLRSRLRTVFDGAPCPVAVLPGNHDQGAYRAGQDWGERVRLLHREPVHEIELGGVSIVGAPFPSEPVDFARVRRHVADVLGPGRQHVLALHGTVVAADARVQAESQDDEPGRYFPVRLEELAGLDAAYVAFGHYHQHARWDAGGVPVAYSGSPAPVGSHAWGPRRAVLAELDGGTATVRPVRLPVGYRQRIRRWLVPFREREGLDELSRDLREAADPRCSMKVTVEGVLAGITEAELREALDRMKHRLGDGYAALEADPESVGLEPARADLFREFQRRLDAWPPAGVGGDGRVAAPAIEGELLATAPGEELRHRALEMAARALTS